MSRTVWLPGGGAHEETDAGTIWLPGGGALTESDAPAPNEIAGAQLIPAFTQLARIEIVTAPDTVEIVTASDTDAAGVYRPFILVEIEWQ